MKIAPTVLMATIRLNLVRWPLMHPCVVEECLDMNRRRLIASIENGELQWAFDLGKNATRREIRVLAHCVVEKATGIIPAIGSTKNLNLPEVISLILPQRRETLRGAELQRLFHGSSDMIRDLKVAGEIQTLRENLPATGPNASPRFTRASLAEFLTKRRVL